MAEPAVHYAYYGDDFTGATDTLSTVARGGLRAMLFLGVPQDRHLQATGPLDVVGVAGAARSLDPERMSMALKPVARFLAATGARVIHYKCCSTFDSAPQVGNLATAVRLMRRAAPEPGLLAILGGQPSLGRHCAFGHLFAAAGQGGPVHRIDRHPTMSVHPVTPMHEADLRRHLAAQGLDDLALVDWRSIRGGDAELQRAVQDGLASHPAGILFDVLSADDLPPLGRMLWREAARAPLLAVGASSVAQALLSHWPGDPARREARHTPGIAPATGPVFVLAGSLSPVTAAQVQRAGPSFERLALDAQALVASDHEVERVAGQAAGLLQQGCSVLAHTPSQHDLSLPSHELAQACARLLARTVRLAPQVRRVGVAGGDSSSHAVLALGAWGLSHAGSLSPGVSLVRAHAEQAPIDGLELMLKGGQMGPPDLFERLLQGSDET